MRRPVALLVRLAAILPFVLAAGVPARAQKPAARGGGAILPGGNPRQPINIQAGKLDYFDKEQKLVYTGNVLAVNGESKLKCSVLVIYLPPRAEGQSGAPASTAQVQRMEATGPVTMVQRDQIGTGDRGVYDKAANTVVLTGSVTLSQGPNVTKGDRLVYDLGSGQANVTSAHPDRPVISVFEPGHADEKPAKPGARRGPNPEAATQ